MNRQREIIVTVTYNELGIIIDTKAELRKTGWWEKAETDWKPKEWVPWLCSECGYRVGRSRTRFCPNCGSLMLKEGEV